MMRLSDEDARDHFELVEAPRIKREVDALLALRHTLSVTHLYGVYESPARVYIVTERCTGGEIVGDTYERNYTEVQIATIMRSVLRTIAQCHAQGMIHGDVKPENYVRSATALPSVP